MSVLVGIAEGSGAFLKNGEQQKQGQQVGDGGRSCSDSRWRRPRRSLRPNAVQPAAESGGAGPQKGLDLILSSAILAH